MAVVSVTKHIPASKDSLWEAISSERNLENFHPFCQSNNVKTWAKDESIDELIYLNNRTYTRKWREWTDGKGYALTISNGRFTADVDWCISGDENSSNIMISIKPKFLPNNPIKKWFAHQLIIKHRLRNYLDHVLSGLATYLTTGEKIQRNQFGEHPWFS